MPYSLGTGENFSWSLKLHFIKLSHSHPIFPALARISFAIRAMNDTLHEDNQTPSLLAFGALPRLPLVCAPVAMQGGTIDAFCMAGRRIRNHCL